MPSVSQLQRLTGALMGIPPWQGMNLAGIGIFPTGAFSPVGAGQVNAQWRLWKLINEVEVIGGVTVPASALNNNTFIAPYRLPAPRSIQQIPMVVQGQASAAISTPYFQIDQFGTPSFKNLPATTTTVYFHGWYSLDA